MTHTNRRTQICAHMYTQTCTCKHLHKRRNSHTRTHLGSFLQLINNTLTIFKPLTRFCEGLLLPLSSSPPAIFIIIMFLIIPESQRKRHAVLHFLGSQVQRRFWDRLRSERRLLTTECRQDHMGLHSRESERFCVCVCV